MWINRTIRDGFAWLELIFVLVVIALLFQLFPLWNGFIWAIDVRNWSRAAWMTLSVLILVTLIGIRFGSELYAEWRRVRPRRSVKRETDKKQLTLKEERALYERMNEARKRQVI